MRLALDLSLNARRGGGAPGPYIVATLETILESASVGDLWATLSTVNKPDDWGDDAYTITADPDSVAQLDGADDTLLEVGAALDFETASSHSVQVTNTPTGPYDPITLTINLPVGNVIEAPVNLVAPAITGTAEVGQTLSCSTGTWTDMAAGSYAYAWEADGTPIDGATASTYALSESDAGAVITCVVTATNVTDSASEESAATAEVAMLTVAAITEGFVYGLQSGDTSRAVPFSGVALGLTGDVEIRLLYEDNSVHTDWTTVATIAAGAWSGTPTINKTSNGWVTLEARCDGLPAYVVTRDELFGVGWKVAAYGQSQMEHAFTYQDVASPLTSGEAAKGSLATPHGTSGNFLERFSVNSAYHSDGARYFLKQWLAYGDDTPICIVAHALNGTSPLEMIDDAEAGRDWDDDDVSLDTLAGSDPSAVMWQWISSIVGQNQENVLDATFYGTGVLAADHSFDDVYPAGYGKILSPATRATTTSTGPFDTDQTNYAVKRADQVAWFVDESGTIGPYVSDMQIEAAGGPHQDRGEIKGSPLLGVRLAMAFARHVGLDTSTNPSIGSPEFNEGRTTITLTVTLPNGGTLTTDGADSAVTGFEVQDGGTGSWTRSGFTAAIADGDVVLTKTSGAWSAGTKIAYHRSGDTNGGPMSYGTDGPSEATLLAGVLYETYALDILGLGLPIAPMASTVVQSLAGAAPTVANIVTESTGDTLAGYTAAAGSNRMLHVHLAYEDTADPKASDPGMTWGVVSLIRLEHANITAFGGGAIYYLLEADFPSGATGDIVASYTDGPPQQRVITAKTVIGGNQAEPVHEIATNSSASSLSDSITPASDNSLIIASAFSSSPSYFTWTNGETEQTEVRTASTMGSSVATLEADAEATTVGYNSTSSDGTTPLSGRHVLISVAIAPA